MYDFKPSNRRQTVSILYFFFLFLNIVLGFTDVSAQSLVAPPLVLWAKFNEISKQIVLPIVVVTADDHHHHQTSRLQLIIDVLLYMMT